jgi:hypothetical protein
MPGFGVGELELGRELREQEWREQAQLAFQLEWELEQGQRLVQREDSVGFDLAEVEQELVAVATAVFD